MSSEHLTDYILNVAMRIAGFMPKLGAAQLDYRGIDGLRFAFRQYGVCSLLLYGTADAMFERCMQSAGACAYYLDRASDDQNIASLAKRDGIATESIYPHVPRTILWALVVSV
jgi:hypothetical protein